MKSLLTGALVLCAASMAPASVQVLTSAHADEVVNACGAQIGDSPIFSARANYYSTFGIKIEYFCGTAGGGNYNLELFNDGLNQVAPAGQAALIANAPPGLGIVQATVPSMSLYETVGTGYVADMIWTGGQERVADNSTDFSIPFARPGVPNFGFTLTCAGPGYCPSDSAYIGMNQMQLVVDETVPPSLVADGGSLWYKGSAGGGGSSTWVRGSWSLGFSASAPSGIASMSASMAGETVGGPPPPPCWPAGTAPSDPSTEWQQCANGQDWTPTVTLTGNGPEQLTLAATSVAQNTSPYTETVDVDTTQPTVALSGPTQASSTAGTQYVTATASTGPSGLGSINCSVDGGPGQSYQTSPAEVPVSGLGSHSVTCNATNRSFDAAGDPATSAPATWSVDIGQPTVAGVWFGRVVGLQCKKINERIKVKSGWVIVRRHHKLVRVHRPARTEIKKVTKCHPRIVRRKVTVLVKVRRHGRIVTVKRKKIQKVVVPPHGVAATSERVRYGRGATVSGWVGAAGSNVGLDGRPVEVMTAPDNGSQQWSVAATATTTASGSWTATLPAGTSRLIEAVYPGDSVTLAAASGQVKLLVPARVGLSISPRVLPWSGTITIRGHLVGGYVPADGVAMQLKIWLPHRKHPYTPVPFRNKSHGTFELRWSFASGAGVERVPFSVATVATESDYAYSAGSSRRLDVTFGKATPRPRGRHRRRK